MLVITKGTNSTIRPTLQEKVTLTDPYYLFVFENDMTKEKVIFMQENTSTHQERYDEFIITERSTSLNYSSGIIELNPAGTWTYYIYEQSSSSNLVEANAGTLLEKGILKVIGTSETWTPYTGQDITYTVYER